MTTPRRRTIPWDRLLEEAHRRFGVDHFRPGQRALLEAALTGRDAIGVLPTGAGKSLCFQLPALFLPGAVVVVSPLIALMQDQQDKLAEAEIDAAKLDSTLTVSEQRETVAQIREGERPIVYVTPERLEKPEALDALRATGVSLFVVDEAHCISQWGHDFRTAYMFLREARRALGSPPVLALTATATPDVIGDIREQLGMQGAQVISTGIERPNLFFEVHRTVNEQTKIDHLQKIFAEEPGTGIIYVATVKEVESLVERLTAAGVDAGRYHGRLRTAERQEQQQRFMEGNRRVMVATKAFGMGIDKSDIRFVVHWQFPDSVETYYQEAGRAGRDGDPARAVLLYRLEDRRVQAYFLGGKYPGRDEAWRVCEVLQGVPAGETLSAAEVAGKADLGERRVRVVLAWLHNAGAIERRRGRFAPGPRFSSASELERFIEEREHRMNEARERLESMMRYAQSTECRMRYLRRYFSEDEGEECGHCDNCRDHPATRLAEAARQAEAETAA